MPPRHAMGSMGYVPYYERREFAAGDTEGVLTFEIDAAIDVLCSMAPDQQVKTTLRSAGDGMLNDPRNIVRAVLLAAQRARALNPRERQRSVDI